MVIGVLTREDKNVIKAAYEKHIKGMDLAAVKMTDSQRNALLEFEKVSGKYAEQISIELGISPAFATEMRKIRKTALHQVSEMRSTRSPVRAEILMQKYGLKNVFPSVVQAYKMQVTGSSLSEMQVKRVSEHTVRKIHLFEKLTQNGATIAETAIQLKVTEHEIRAMRKIRKQSKETLIVKGV